VVRRIMRKQANKLSDVFADERVNILELAQQTALIFTPSMTARLHQFLRWHTHNQNGRKSETHPITLDKDHTEGV
jgi:hypothetical protein